MTMQPSPFTAWPRSPRRRAAGSLLQHLPAVESADFGKSGVTGRFRDSLYLADAHVHGVIARRSEAIPVARHAR